MNLETSQLLDSLLLTLRVFSNVERGFILAQTSIGRATSLPYVVFGFEIGVSSGRLWPTPSPSGSPALIIPMKPSTN